MKKHRLRSRSAGTQAVARENATACCNRLLPEAEKKAARGDSKLLEIVLRYLNPREYKIDLGGKAR